MATDRSQACDLLCLDLPHAEQVRARIGDLEHVQAAAERAKALSDVSRLRIACALAAGGALCVCDLAWICALSQNLVSHHLRRLRAADLVTSRREGKLVIYQLTAPGAALVAAITAPVPALSSTAAESAATPAADSAALRQTP